MSRKNEYGLTLLVLLAGALLALVAAAQPWASVSIESALRREVLEPSGRDLAPSAAAAPLVALAGVLAVLATRRAGRVIVGVVLVATGLALAAGVAAAAGGLSERTVDWVRVQAGEVISTSDVTTTAWPWLAVAGAVLIAVAATAVVLRGREWPAMGARYERPASAGSASEPRTSAQKTRDEGSRGVWDALDRGEDPTREASGSGS